MPGAMVGFADRWIAVQQTRLGTGRGRLAAGIVVFIALLVFAGTPSAGAVVLLVVISPALWLLAWWLAGIQVAVWRQLVAGKPPDISVGRSWQPGSTRQQLREDHNARFFTDRGGILLRRRRWFIATGTPPIHIEPDHYDAWCPRQEENPQLVAWYGDRSYYWYAENFYWTNREDLSPADVKALLFARERQRQREIDHAHAVMAAASSPAARKREPIPRDVKHAVFQRDEGRCVECGSNFDIQYDHVIPFAMGGANTVENLQLLCGRCNQRKGGRL
jgi:HNH endonuclease